MTAARSDAVLALVDLSFCLAMIREGREPDGGPLLGILLGFQPGEVGIAAPTVADLLQRAATSSDPARNREALDQFLLPLVAVPFDAPAALHLSRLHGSPAGRERAVTSESAFAAATALARDLLLLTCEPAQYAHISGLRLVSHAPRQARPLLPPSQAAGVILAMGSHDLTLELVGDRLHALRPEVLFCSAHVGSLAGLYALLRGDAHLAGVHLLDEETGEYNVPALRALFEPHGRHAVLVRFVGRVQGMVVAQGNPLGLRDVAGALSAGARMVNRQAGSGTRLLLDRELRALRVEGAQVAGYEDVEQAHSGVAAAVAAGRAQWGLGIEAGARARGLDFVPLFRERYDLAIPVEHFESARLAPLLALLREPGSHLLGAIHALGGYTTEAMGRVVAEC